MDEEGPQYVVLESGLQVHDQLFRLSVVADSAFLLEVADCAATPVGSLSDPRRVGSGLKVAHRWLMRFRVPALDFVASVEETHCARRYCRESESSWSSIGNIQ